MSPIDRVRARVAAAEVLGLDSYADRTEVRTAWRRAAKELHPDKADGDAGKFLNAAAAYEFLSGDGSDEGFEAERPDVAKTQASNSRRVRAVRPRIPAHETRIAPTVIAKCWARLGVLEFDRGPGSRPASDHVPTQIIRQGRHLIYDIPTPLVSGRNRVALPADLLRDSDEPAVVVFASMREGAGEIVIPDAQRQVEFPRARGVCLRFLDAGPGGDTAAAGKGIG